MFIAPNLQSDAGVGPVIRRVVVVVIGDRVIEGDEWARRAPIAQQVNELFDLPELGLIGECVDGFVAQDEKTLLAVLIRFDRLFGSSHCIH